MYRATRPEVRYIWSLELHHKRYNSYRNTPVRQRINQSSLLHCNKVLRVDSCPKTRVRLLRKDPLIPF